VTTETRPTDKNDEVVETKTRPMSDEIAETELAEQNIGRDPSRLVADFGR
jgi:hypothetical protein